jgi:hypothetical protein
LIFVDACKDLVMTDDVVTLSNPPFVPVEEEKFEEASLDMNLSQRSCDEDPFQRVVRTQVIRLAWDHRSSPNPHALTIYLEFVLVREVAPKRFEECQCEDDGVRFHYRTWVPDDDHYHWLQGPINSLPMECRAEYLARTIRCLLDFL